ncbi:MAG: hypothetical protein MJ025_05985, partial [Victivallaceae bacterium]|nr:hypothetical protein [Victivallaceae bacterium]
LGAARMLAHIACLSEESLGRKFGRHLQDKQVPDYRFGYDFAVESYLNHQGEVFVDRFDANSYLYVTRASDYYDLTANTDGDLCKALEPMKAEALVLSFSSDWLFPTCQSRELVRAMLKDDKTVSFCEIKSGYGHDAFLLETDREGAMIRDFLRHQEVRQ